LAGKEAAGITAVAGEPRTVVAGAVAGAIAAACGPRRGSKVERCTNSGVVAIFGMPLC